MILFKFIRFLITIANRLTPRLSGWIAYHLFFLPIGRKYRTEEIEYLESMEKEDFLIDNRSVYLYFKGEGPYTLFCHGWAGNSMQFRKFIEAIESERSIMLVDMPAHGSSPGVQTDAVAFSFTIEHILNHYNIENIICHSLAGMSLALALTRGSDQPDKAVFISTTTSTNDILEFFVNQIGGDYRTRERLVQLLQKRFNRSFNDFNAAEILKEYEKTPKSLVVLDDSDPQVKVSNGEELATVLNADLYLSSGLGHNRLLKDEKVVSQVVAFLAT